MHHQRVEAHSGQDDGVSVEPWSDLNDDDFYLAAEASIEALYEGEEEELSPDDIEELPDEP
ncbi:hypothetical protein [Nannocystis bainbridge]|uniref:Uncharacterized protein n=1 Tax=Nannocystis bainbridge TaxID=2995303 RepID=A0ABT5DPT4_9BACT|nr:hypothetical protein [Nannocystis bainbridge]MDC0715665.1 hypothetical protein [Nannocystis bainbridge]